MQHLGSSRLVGTMLILCIWPWTVGAQIQETFEAGDAPKSWPRHGTWQLGADPEAATNRVLHTDATASFIPSITIPLPTSASPDTMLSFRARFETPYPGMGGGGKPDGQHFPNWKLRLPIRLDDRAAELVVEESFAWNALLIHGPDLKARIEGSRAPAQWHQYVVAIRGGRLCIAVDGLVVLDRAFQGSLGNGNASLTVQHMKVWVDDVKFGPFDPAALEPSATDSPDPSDYILQDDFGTPRLSNLWNSGGDWSVTADPDTPDNRVVHGLGDKRPVTLFTRNASFTDYTLSFRIRFETPHKAFPHHDEVHFPHWAIMMRRLPDGREVALVDSFIWGSQRVTSYTGGYPQLERRMPRGQWRWMKIIAHRDTFEIYMEGELLTRAVVPDVLPGAIGFRVMDGELWVDDVVMTAHPAAKLHETFARGIDGSLWESGEGWGVPGNQSPGSNRYAQGSPSGGLLKSRASYGDGVLSFRVMRPSPTDAGRWTAVLRSGEASSLALRAEGGRLSLGRLTGDQFESNAEVDASPAVPGKRWDHYRVVLSGNICRVYANGRRMLESLIDLTQPQGAIAFIPQGPLMLDDVTVSALPVPRFRFEPVALGAIFSVSEIDKGFKVHLRSDDFESQTIQNELVVTAQDGTVLGRVQADGTLQAEAKLTQALSVVVERVGIHEARLRILSDGREVGSMATTLTVLPDQPARSPAFEPKLGLIGARDPGSLSLMTKAGTGWLRGAFAFDWIGKNAQGDWDFAKQDATYATLAEFPGLRVVDLYLMNNGRGHTLEGINEYAQTVAAVIGHFRERDLNLQAWNEPNHEAFWRNAPRNAADYASLLKHAVIAAKAADPQVTILGPTTSGAASGFVRDAFIAGAYPYLDVLAYHPYGYPKHPEELLEPATLRMKEVVDDFGGWLQHHITEHGYVTAKNGVGVSEPVQAQYQTRTQLIANSLDHLRALNIYRLEDTGTNDQNSEHRFGVLHLDKTAKPAFLALAVMSAQLVNSDYIGSLPVGAQGAMVQVYRRFDGTPILAAWSVEAQSIELPVVSDQMTRTTMLGEQTQARLAGTLQLALSGSPQYILLSADDSGGDGVDSAVCMEPATLPD